MENSYKGKIEKKTMKKLHTIIAMVAIVIFGLLFAAFDTSSPPTSAENLPTVEFQPGHSIRHLFVAESDNINVSDIDVGDNGDIPIVSDLSSISQTAKFSESTNFEAAQNRRTEIKTLLTVISEVRNKPPERFKAVEFVSNLSAFSGFGVDTLARAKM